MTDQPEPPAAGSDKQLIACCGLDCSACDMREATTNHKLQEEFARWFKEERNIDVKTEEIGCTWCRGGRAGGRHWSADCWILKCCADDHGHDHCSQCEDFACEKLEEWSRQNDRYTAALDRLRDMHENCFD